MKAIIIQDTDASNLLDLLKLEQFSEPGMYDTGASEAWHSIPERERQVIKANVHRKFHYIVCRWLQEQGASCVR